MDRELCTAPSDSCSSPPFPFQCLSIFRGTSTPLALLRLQIPILILRWGPCLGLDGKVSRMWILHNQNTSFEDWKFRCWAPAGFHWPLQNGRIRAAAKRGEKEIQIRRWCWSVLYSQSECLQSWPRSWGGAMAMAGDDQRSSPNLLQSPLGTDWWPYHTILYYTIPYSYHNISYHIIPYYTILQELERWGRTPLSREDCQWNCSLQTNLQSRIHHQIEVSEQGVVTVKLQLADQSPVHHILRNLS